MIQRRWPTAERPSGRPWEAYLLLGGPGWRNDHSHPRPHPWGVAQGGGSCCRKTPPHPGPFRREPRDPARVDGGCLVVNPPVYPNLCCWGGPGQRGLLPEVPPPWAVSPGRGTRLDGWRWSQPVYPTRIMIVRIWAQSKKLALFDGKYKTFGLLDDAALEVTQVVGSLSCAGFAPASRASPREHFVGVVSASVGNVRAVASAHTRLARTVNRSATRPGGIGWTNGAKRPWFAHSAQRPPALAACSVATTSITRSPYRLRNSTAQTSDGRSYKTYSYSRVRSVPIAQECRRVALKDSWRILGVPR
jgi:hypothetical protein